MERNRNIRSTRSAGGKEMSRGLSIGRLEEALSKEIAQRAHFHYDELCRNDGRSRVRAIRLENGCIDVLGTFLKAQRNCSVAWQVDSL